MGNFENLYKKLLSYVSFLQTWEGQILMKKVETEIISNFFVFHKNKIGLEIGCGNGFQSSFLAKLSQKVTATDLYCPDTSSHTVGMSKAKTLLKSSVIIKNIDLLSCSSEYLPFKDNHFDYVFSSSVLEHVKDKEKTIKEMKRVLKTGGYIIAIVPNFMLSIYAFTYLPLYILKRIFDIALGKLNIAIDKKENINIKTDSRKKVNLLSTFLKNHPHFPLPEPHGYYKSIFHEFYESFPVKWENLFKKNGLIIEDSRTSCIIPWSILEVFSTKLAAIVYSSTRRLHQRFRLPKTFSYLFCIRSQKIN